MNIKEKIELEKKLVSSELYYNLSNPEFKGLALLAEVVSNSDVCKAGPGASIVAEYNERISVILRVGELFGKMISLEDNNRDENIHYLDIDGTKDEDLTENSNVLFENPFFVVDFDNDEVEDGGIIDESGDTNHVAREQYTREVVHIPIEVIDKKTGSIQSVCVVPLRPDLPMIDSCIGFVLMANSGFTNMPGTLQDVIEQLVDPENYEMKERQLFQLRVRERKISEDLKTKMIPFAKLQTQIKSEEDEILWNQIHQLEDLGWRGMMDLQIGNNTSTTDSESLQKHRIKIIDYFKEEVGVNSST
ncbi:MAG: hypothetical protein HOF57_01055 [Euryarchaeota archaeon]|jgi:hypothetical protein|nr:hypothetical protein [Euryarchaeota archaeon]MBT4662551.1 hypothetical protein [Candidatus Neomarinimicrobiota bacterium]MBT5223821.1 hypothetical protein [Candidatus Neomarinimicrobiota bacterium]